MNCVITGAAGHGEAPDNKQTNLFLSPDNGLQGQAKMAANSNTWLSQWRTLAAPRRGQCPVQYNSLNNLRPVRRGRKNLHPPPAILTPTPQLLADFIQILANIYLNFFFSSNFLF